MVSDELQKIVDDAYNSSYSKIASVIFSSVISQIIIISISSTGYGLYTTITKNISILHRVFGGIFTSMSRTIPREDGSKKNTIVVYSLLIIGFFFTLLLIPIFIFRNIIKTSVLSSSSNILLYASIGYFCISLFLNYTINVLQGYKKIRESNTISNWISPIIKISLLATTYFIISQTIQTILLTFILANILATVFGVIAILKYTDFNLFDIKIHKSLVTGYSKYILSATMVSILTGLQYTAPNIMLTIVSPQQAGAFGVAAILTYIVKIPLSSVNSIFPQVASELYDEGKIKIIDSLLKSTPKIAGFIAFIPSVVLTVYHKEIIGLFSATYTDYSIIILILAVGKLIAVQMGTVGYLIMMTDNERENIVIQFFLTVVTLIVSYFLTIEYGVLGLATGFSIGLTLNNTVEIVHLHYSENLFPLTIHHIYIFFNYSITSILLYFIHYEFGLILSIPMCVITTIISTYINYRFALNSNEREALRNKGNSVASYIHRKLSFD